MDLRVVQEIFARAGHRDFTVDHHIAPIRQPQRVIRILLHQKDRHALRLVDVADHIDHIKAVAGIEAIGLGADFDGMPPGPVGLEDVSTYPALLKELLIRGYSDQDIAKIAGENLLRVMTDVEAVAARLQTLEMPRDDLLHEIDRMHSAQKTQ